MEHYQDDWLARATQTGIYTDLHTLDCYPGSRLTSKLLRGHARASVCGPLPLPIAKRRAATNGVSDIIGVVTNPPLTDQRRVLHLCHHLSSPCRHGSLKQLHNTAPLQIRNPRPLIHLPPLPHPPIPDNMRPPAASPPPPNPRRIPVYDTKILRIHD